MKKKLFAALLTIAMLFTLCGSAFAANSKGVTWVASLDKESVTNDVDQTVTLTLAPNAPVTLDAFDYVINYPGAPIAVNSVSCADPRITFSGADLNLNLSATQAMVLFGTEDAENLDNVACIGTVEFIVPAGTAAGTYNFSVSEINASIDYGSTSWSSSDQSTTATLTVTAPEAAPGYSAAVPSNQSVAMGETTALAISLSSGNAATYNSYYFELTYDAAKLEYVSATEGASVDSTTPGKLVVTGYGEDKAITTPVTVNFTGIAAGDAEVSLTKANVDQAVNAAVQDAAEATITNAKTVIHIGGYEVSLPTGVTGDSTAIPGQDYTFAVNDTHYDYTFIATMGGETVSVIDNGDGTFTIKNVSGVIAVTLVEKTAKSYTVTLVGDGTLTDGSSATYLQDYHFARGSDSGYTYSVAVTIGGATFTGYSVTGAYYTIPGASVTGNIVITVTKTEIPPTPGKSYTVTIEGNAAGDATVVSATVEEGGDAVLNLTPIDGYDYTVTATMGGETVDVTENENTYTVSNVTGNVVFTVNKTPVSDMVIAASKYLELDEGIAMWLVKATGTLDEGKVFAYGDTAMYYSEKYSAYCWLVISAETEEEVKAAAEAAVTKVTAEAVTVDYSGDVNGTKLVDVNDAQFIWNMYNVYYKTFDDCAMLKFLCADITGDAVVSTQDAAAVIDIVLHPAAE